jgi:hypothetical protein
VSTKPDPFAEALSALDVVEVHPEIEISSAPAPGRLAPFAHAVTAQIGLDPEVGSGRFVLLHDPSRPPTWESDCRIVVYVEADIDAEMEQDQLLTDVGWAWVQECLTDSGLGYHALGGTVTATRSTSYEALSARGHENSIQIRASWSPERVTEVAEHYAVWLALMETCAGLPPHHPGVSRIGDIS